MTGCSRTHHTTCTPDAGQISLHEAGEQEWLSCAEITLRSTSAATAIERRRWQVIGLLAGGAPMAEIVAATGYRPRTIREIAQRYQECGPVGLMDGRQRSVGADPLLAEEQQRDLRQALQGPAPDGGIWTGPKVARWIAARTGKRVHRQRGWEYLRRLGSTAVAAGGQQAPHSCDDDTNRSA
jgi:transposase